MPNVSRDELYQQVWSIPGSTLAKTFGVSETYLRKVCFALDVPRPPPGYWQQVAVGRILPRPPLPPRNPLRPSGWGARRLWRFINDQALHAVRLQQCRTPGTNCWGDV